MLLLEVWFLFHFLVRWHVLLLGTFWGWRVQPVYFWGWQLHTRLLVGGALSRTTGVVTISLRFLWVVLLGVWLHKTLVLYFSNSFNFSTMNSLLSDPWHPRAINPELIAVDMFTIPIHRHQASMCMCTCSAILELHWSMTSPKVKFVFVLHNWLLTI